jgi:thermitase
MMVDRALPADRRPATEEAVDVARRGWIHAAAISSLVAVVLCMWGQPLAGGTASADDYLPDRILVKFQPGTPASEVARAHASARSVVLKDIPGIDVQVVGLPRGLSVARGIGLYQHNPNVEYAEPDYLFQEQTTVPNDPWYQTWQLQLQSIHSGEAWDITRGSPDVRIAVLDSGLAYDHPDVQGRYVLGPDFVNDDDDPWDDNGHGTGVYGVVGATTNNALGIASVTWHSPVLVVKVASYAGSASVSVICEGLVYAADSGVRAANLSLSGPYYSQSMQDAIDYAWSNDLIVVCAAGNYGDDTLRYPAACDHAIGVSAVDGDDELVYWSSYGSYIDLCAPHYMRSLTTDGGYGNWAGTSIAAPYVLGAIALIASADPTLSAQQIVDTIQQSADDLGAPGWDQYYGWGKINLYRAVVAAGQQSPEDTLPPEAVLVAPSDGAVLAGTVSVAASASDDVGVTQVEFYADGRLLGTDTVAPYACPWYTQYENDGWHTLAVLAYDAAGNAGPSLPVAVCIDNTPPAIDIISPAPGAAVSAITPVEAAAADQVRVARVEFYLDSSRTATTYAWPYIWNWDTAQCVNGWHTILARAVDDAGNICDSDILEVNVQNSSAPVQQTEVFTGRAGGRNGWVSAWVTTDADGLLSAALSYSGRSDLELYLYDAAGNLLARDTSSSNPKLLNLLLPRGSYEFVIGSYRWKSDFTLEVTHF